MSELRITVADFGCNHIEQFPVWEYVDPIDTWEEDTELRPIALSDNILPDNTGTLLIRARFRTLDRTCLSGYIISPSAYAFVFCVAGKEVVFNANLPELMDREIQELFTLLGIHINIFPLSYETDFVDTNGMPIKGTISVIE